MNDFLHKDETHKIIGARFEVYKEQCCGFLELVYQKCMDQGTWVCLLLMSTAMAVSAATGYVATDGKAENDGSRAKPWPSVEHALFGKAMASWWPTTSWFRKARRPSCSI